MRHSPTLPLALTALLAAACQTPTHAPLPYSSEQIRDAHPDGTLLRFRMTQQGNTIVQCMRFENGSDETVDVVSWTEQENGERIGAPSSQTSTWAELRDHGKFEHATTTRERSRIEVAAGSYDCWHYTVAGANETAPVTHFHFADDKPGPPVRLLTTRGDAEVMRMELLEYRRGR